MDGSFSYMATVTIGAVSDFSIHCITLLDWLLIIRTITYKGEFIFAPYCGVVSQVWLSIHE